MYVALDIGGTKTLVAVFDLGGQLVEQVKFPTPADYEEFKNELKEQASSLATKVFEAGAVGIRGNIDRDAGLSLHDDVLLWGAAPVRDDCKEIFGCPFMLENDSKLAGLSEAVALGKQFEKVLYLTISTGIGSAFIVNGVLDKDTENSEIGKGVYEHEGKLQQWEDFASGKAIVAKYGKRASEIEDASAWHDISMNIAVGLIDAILAFTPDVVVIGGGVGSHFHKFGQSLIEIMNSIKPDEITLPEVRGAKRPEEAVIYGCLELARTQHAA